MKRSYFLIVCIFFFHYLCSQWRYLPFDYAMRSYEPGFANRLKKTFDIVGIDGHELYTFFKHIYTKNQPDMIAKKTVPTIPKVIHQIWLGSAVPETLQPFMDSWVTHHLGSSWRYMLWTDAEIAHIPLYNQEFYDETDNYGIKSDIARYEIIYRYGGVYIDTDFECLQPLDMFHEYYDFYTALQPLDTQFVQLGVALFGACPGHPILKKCIESIKDDWHLQGAPKKTGPVHFTKCFYAIADTTDRIDIALPAFYFYPLGCQERRDYWKHNGAYGVHWWSKTWMPKAYRMKTFQTIDNEDSTKQWNT